MSVSQDSTGYVAQVVYASNGANPVKIRAAAFESIKDKQTGI